MKNRDPHSSFVSWVALVLAIPAILGTSHTSAREPGRIASAQADQTGSVELEQLLFVQAPGPGGAKDGIVLVWLPEPLEKLCLGKTAKRCATIDYCIRTTNPEVAECRNLGVNLSRVRPYPPDMRPRRMISMTMFKLREMNGNGYGLLQKYYNSLPPASLQHLSMSARIKARIRFTRKPDDDDWELLQVIAAPAD